MVPGPAEQDDQPGHDQATEDVEPEQSGKRADGELLDVEECALGHLVAGNRVVLQAHVRHDHRECANQVAEVHELALGDVLLQMQQPAQHPHEQDDRGYSRVDCSSYEERSEYGGIERIPQRHGEDPRDDGVDGHGHRRNGR